MAEKSSTPDLNEGPYTFPFNLVKDTEVKGEDEKPYKLGDILGKSKNILLFTRHFGWYVCRDYVKAVVASSEKYKEELKSAGITDESFVLIGLGAASWLKRYREDTGFKGKMFTDPEKKVQEALALIHVNSMSELRGDGSSSEYVQSNIWGLGWSALKFYQAGGSSQLGDAMQQGAVFVLDKDAKALFHHFERFPSDHAKIEDVFRSSGAKL